MLELKNISKTYVNSKRKVEAIKNVNLTLEEKGFVLISGESGSGKSTLLSLIAGIIEPSVGELKYKNKVLQTKKDILDYRVHNIGFIFQEYNLIEDLSIKENFLLVKSIKNLDKDESDVTSILNKVNLLDVENSLPSELSGGQRQRVAIARALFSESNIILADEPTGALDEKNAQEILNILKDISKNKLVIVVSHNISLTEPYADRVIKLSNGEIVKDDVYIQNSYVNNDIEKTEFKSRGLSLEYSLKIGLRYFRFKTFKLYLSICILIISFVLLLIVTGVMFFDEDVAYNMGIKNENIGYLVIDKYENQNNAYNKEFFTKSEVSVIESGFNHINLILFGDYINTSIRNSTNDKSFIAKGITEISQEKAKAYGFNLIGKFPKENEVVITSEEANLLAISVDNYESASIIIDFISYRVSGILEIQTNKDIEDSSTNLLNWLIFTNEKHYKTCKEESVVTEILVESSDFSNINEISNTLLKNDSNYVYKFNNIVFNSILRMQIFVDSIIKIGSFICAIFIVFSLLLLMNFVYGSILENKRDIKIIKMLGGKNIDIFKIFIIHPLFITLFSLVFAIGGYCIVNNLLNDFIKNEFSLFIPILSLTMSKILIIIITILFIVSMSTLIPIIRIKKSK
ncbi:MAG: ABC transporter ATP-binding protein/permease [Roseburia sp.]|nr:ABC transporter ATP-binding protein/permease [Anaeroplasma bactoclasticum]MCM1197036.1 ABC transporter ATP-binding protein/permease [Roseburia sp.]MCM1557875.1 ABC transporter ATP-binding protein/permease [Anaeroplasma bactoclasticum]